MPEANSGNLSFHQVEALMRATSGNDVQKTTSARSWLRPADIRSVLQAVDTDAEQVYIVGQGRYFDIKYKDDKVWLTPTDGAFVPCGWYHPKDLRRQLNESHVITV